MQVGMGLTSQVFASDGSDYDLQLTTDLQLKTHILHQVQYYYLSECSCNLNLN